jgi:hypothetical protein
LIRRYFTINKLKAGNQAKYNTNLTAIITGLYACCRYVSQNGVERFLTRLPLIDLQLVNSSIDPDDEGFRLTQS